MAGNPDRPMAMRKNRVDEARKKGIRLTVSLLSLAVLSIFLYVMFRRA